MNIAKTWQISTTSSEETEQLGEKIGRNLNGGETIELVSDLGGGKTTFVRGLTRGFGSVDNVASPSFTIKREYRSDDKTLHHYDFHRLHEPGEMIHELQDAIDEPKDVAVIEWADIVQGVLPVDHLKIKIQTTGENDRIISFEYPEIQAYLLEGVDK